MRDTGYTTICLRITGELEVVGVNGIGLSGTGSELNR